jgi:hypothetical protein
LILNNPAKVSFGCELTIPLFRYLTGGASKYPVLGINEIRMD